MVHKSMQTHGTSLLCRETQWDLFEVSHTSQNKKAVQWQPRCWQKWRITVSFLHYGRWSKMTQPLWKIVWQSLRKQINKKLNTHLLYNPAITLLGIYPREMQTSVHTKTCTWLFIAVLYVRGENWKLTKISNTRWMFKQKPCTSITRILLSYLKKRTS